jgi:hypothetical protein
MQAESCETPLERNNLESPSLSIIPGLSGVNSSKERHLQLLRLGLVSGHGLNDEDAARLSGELPVAELKLRSQQYLDGCELSNKPNTLAAKGEALDKFFGTSTRTITLTAPKESSEGLSLTSKIPISHPVVVGTWHTAPKRSAICGQPVAAPSNTILFMCGDSFVGWSSKISCCAILRQKSKSRNRKKPHRAVFTGASRIACPCLSPIHMAFA